MGICNINTSSCLTGVCLGPTFTLIIISFARTKTSEYRYISTGCNLGTVIYSTKKVKENVFKCLLQ